MPGNCDVLVAGTSCVDYSNLNNEKKGLEDGGESGQTFGGMMKWVCLCLMTGLATVAFPLICRCADSDPQS